MNPQPQIPEFMSKYLYIVRHGEAETQTLKDYSRKLTPRGQTHLRQAARRLKTLFPEIVPGVILASPAARTMETAGILAEGFELEQYAVVPSEELYLGNQFTYLTRAAECFRPSMGCAMIVGHNPSVSAMLEELCGNDTGLYRMRAGDVALVEIGCGENDPWEKMYLSDITLKKYLIAGSAEE